METVETVETVTLYYTGFGSDKYYKAQLQGTGGETCSVYFEYGPRGVLQSSGYKVRDVPYVQAKKVYDKLVREKKAKGYTENTSGEPFSVPVETTGTDVVPVDIFPPMPTEGGDADGPVKYPVQLLTEIEESGVEGLLGDAGAWAQQKHDGKRMVLEYEDETLKAYNRRGLSCGYPTGYAEACRSIGSEFVLDGESVGDTFWAFDLLKLNGEDLREHTYRERLRQLEQMFLDLREEDKGAIKVVTTARYVEEKRALLDSLKSDGREGIVFKRMNRLYTPGKDSGSQLKFKFCSMATCEVMESSAVRASKSSVAIGVHQFNADGTVQLVPVGNVTISGKGVLKPVPGQFIEVKYLYCRRGGSLYQPVYKGIRDDKEMPDTIDSLKYKDESQDGDEEEAGRGLSNPVEESEEKGSDNDVVEIEVEAIIPNPFVCTKEIDNLVASIRDLGLLQPLVVRKKVDGYEIISGERRFRAMKKLGRDRVPCIVLVTVGERSSGVLGTVRKIRW